jgi:FkbM family methyltransferase
MVRLDMMGVRLVSRAIRRLPVRGRGRVGAYLHQHTMPPAKEMWHIRMNSGYRMRVPASSRQSWIAAFTGGYSEEVIKYIEPLIEPESSVLDIGASLGFYTIPLALAARKRGARVVAFEPVGGNCSILRGNLELNQLTDVVTVVQTALGSHSGQVTLHIEDGGSGNAAVVSGLSDEEISLHDQTGRLTAAEETRLATLDSLALFHDELVNCSLMKMDVEGFELDVLKGAKSFLESSRPIIVAEFSQEWLRSRHLGAQGSLSWSKEFNYQCFELARRRNNFLTDSSKVAIVPVEDERRGRGDLILFPSERHSNPVVA